MLYIVSLLHQSRSDFEIHNLMKSVRSQGIYFIHVNKFVYVYIFSVFKNKYLFEASYENLILTTRYLYVYETMRPNINN